MRTLLKGIALVGLLACAGVARGQAASPAGASPGQSQKTVEAYLRHMYAFGSDVQVTVAAPKESQIPGLLEVDVVVKIGENSENAAGPLRSQRRGIA